LPDDVPVCPLPRAFAKRGNKFNRYLGDARAPRSSLYPCVCSASTGSLLTPDRRVRFSPSMALPCTIPPVSYVPCTIFVSQPPHRVQKAPAIVHGGASRGRKPYTARDCKAKSVHVEVPQGRKPYTARGTRTKSSVLGRRTGKRLSPYVTWGSVLAPAPGGASYGGLMVPAVVRRASGGAIPGLRRQNGAVPVEAARLNDMRSSYAAPRVT